MLPASAKYSYIFFSAVFLFLFLLMWLAPYQVIDPDSVAGFRALQGWKTTGKFNCIIQPEQSDISVFHSFFLTWWTPGQYLFPHFIQQIFYITLGRSITVLNFLAVFGGLVGFYKLFRFYQFPEKVILLSLLLILFSHTLLYRFILYQGGETFSFLFFPWLTWLYVRVKKKILQAALTIVLLIAGFIAKSQLLIALIPLFFLVPLSACAVDLRTGGAGWLTIKGMFKSIFYAIIAVAISLFLIYVFFISKGVTPANIARFNPSLLDTFTPLASPVTAIANGWSVLLRIGERYPYVQIMLLMASTAIVFFVFMRSGLEDKYNRLVFLYYITGCCIFILLYYFDAHIDYDVRHQKFIGYLFFPILITRLVNSFSFRKVTAGIALLSVFSLTNHFRLCNIWFKDTYITRGDFRLSRTEFPEELYKALSPRKDDKTVLFFSDLSPKWAIDRPDIVCVDSGGSKTYNGHKYHVWYIKREKPGWEAELKNIFPAYNIFESRRVGDYLFVQLH
jgi:hypothetical protein